MALKYDAQGFLVGDRVDISDQLDTWKDIRSDVAAIRQLITRMARPSAAEAPGSDGRPGGVKASGGSMRVAGEGVLRDERGRFARPAFRQLAAPDVSRSDSGRKRDPGAASIQEASDQTPSLSAVETPPTRRLSGSVRGLASSRAERDAGGRFTKSTGNAGEEGRSESKLASAIGSLSDAVLSSGVGIEDADPTIKAFNEVAQPIARGWDLVGGISGGAGSKRQESWLRRIFGELKVFRKEETTYSKASERRLKAIEEKPGDGGDSDGGGILKLLIGFLAKIPLLGGALSGLVAMLSKIGGGLLGKALGGLGAGALAARKGGAASVTPATAAGQRSGIADAASTLPSGGSKPASGAQGGGLRRAATRFGKRIPVLGSLIALGMGAFEASETESNNSLSREQKNAEHSKTAGGVVGGLSGAAAGAAIGSVVPVVGTVIGGILGAVLGDWLGREGGRVVGENLSQISAAANSVWESIKEGANSLWDGLRSGWDSSMSKLSSFAESAKSGWESITGLFRSAYEGLKSLPVIGPVIRAAEDAAAKAKEKLAEGGTKAVEGIKAGAGYLAENTNIGRGVTAAAAAAPRVAAAAKRAYDVTAASAGSALEVVMPNGYRHKALFDGIKGGDSLSKNGSYTDEEAARIRELKTSGANTSANVPGGMSLEVQDKISAQAKKAGLDPVMMQKIAAMESGGNANAVSSTGAIGVYQFTGKTASGVGIKNRFDVDQNIEGGMKLTKQNQAVLAKSGLPVTAESLYMMHQLGPAAAKEVIQGAAAGKSKADMSPETQRAMNLNYGASSKTAADYIATNRKALDDRYASVTKGSSATTEVAQANRPASPTGGGLAAAPASPVNPRAQSASVSPPPAATPPKLSVAAAPSVVASVQVPSVPPASKPIQIPDAPPAVVSMASSSQSSQQVVRQVQEREVGQDVADRRIAHIVTGGLSASA